MKVERGMTLWNFGEICEFEFLLSYEVEDFHQFGNKMEPKFEICEYLKKS